MADELLHYYERELTYLRRTGADFARAYPKVASRLLLEPNKCDDPHVERMLEAFAFLAARVHLRIDEDFPEMSEALLGMVYPQYTRPMPSISMVEFHLDPEQGKLTTGLNIPRGSALYSRPVSGTRCQFRTCYDVTLWPFNVAAVQWLSPHELRPAVRATDAVAALRVELACLPDVTFGQLEIDSLRLHISADANLATTLYELLCNNCLRILVRDTTPGSRKEPLELPCSMLTPVGFTEDDGLLPAPRRAFIGYRLLQEYFTFPDKFFFLDVSGLSRVRAAGFGTRAELVFLLSSFERADRRQLLDTGISRETIRLGCTPIVNLFPKTAEPILLSQRRPEYVVVPDARRREFMGVHSVEDVVAVSPGEPEPIRFEPFYSFRHGSDPARPAMYWHARRRPAGWRMDGGTDVYLSFVDLSGRTVYPDADAVTVRLTCFNGNLPSRLPFGDPAGDFEIAGGGPILGINTLVKPTAVIHPPLGQAKLWKLVSQLSLNYVSLAEGGVDAIRELLRINDVARSPAGEKQIQGIVGVTGRPAYARIDSEHGIAFARGHRVEIEFDEEQFAGGGVYLLASIIERFLGLYVSLNSFCILAARSRQRKEPLREWPPRAGWKPLI